MNNHHRYHCNENNTSTAFSVEAQPRMHHEVGSRIPNSTSSKGFSLTRSDLVNKVGPCNTGISSSKGFTLIEILVVVGLFALLASIGAIIGFDSITRSTVHNERDLTALMLTGARTRALANVNERAHGVRITTDEIILFEGDDFNTGMNKRNTPRNSAITAAIVPNVDIVFNQLSANVPACPPAPDFCTITLSDGSKSATIEISRQGRIEW